MADEKPDAVATGGAGGTALARPKVPTIWAHSNRRDDRVVLWERDPVHPGGEAFIGGSTPDHVAKTPEIERLLREGVLVEVPEPKDGPKKPIPTSTGEEFAPAAQPGQPTPLGRALDPDLFDAGEIKRVQAKQEELPAEVPVPGGVVMPPPAEPERTSRRG